MNKTCTQCGQNFVVTEEDLAFYDKVSPVFGGKKYQIPPPTQCPECRQQRRLSGRNDRNYYSNKCALCKKHLISSYSEQKPFGVLCDSCFWGDDWDPLSYGMQYDFSRPFFEQFSELRSTLPRIAIYKTQSENSDYTVHSSRNRNCYMDSSMIDCEDTHFGDLIFNCINSIDLFSCSKLERCYECTFCDECFQSSYCENCNGLSDCYLCFDCKSSDFLVGCTGIRQGKNKILNQDAEKAEILDTIRKLNTDPNFRIDFESKYQELKLQHPRRASWMINAENCSGTFIWNSKNLYHGFNMRNSEDSRYCYEGNADVSVCDITRNGNCEMLYECANMIDTSYSAFCNLAYQSSEVLYCDNCIGTENSFGCVSLKKQKYCILNTQYSKEEYEDLVPKIIEHMQANGEYGEFFPIEISPFGYNETKSIEWYSMTKSEVIAKGWKWSDYESPITNITKTINANQIPSSIEDIPDEILEWAIICKKSGKPFKIIRQELNFYRSLGLPIPHLCPKERHFARIAPTNVRKLYSRQCAKCSKDIQTTYAPDRPEIVYCEECYLSEVY